MKTVFNFSQCVMIFVSAFPISFAQAKKNDVSQASTQSIKKGEFVSTSETSEESLDYSITTVFPSGGSVPMSNALGLRIKLSETIALTPMLVFSNNTGNEKDKSIFGLSTKFQAFAKNASRAWPYLAGTVYVWKPSGKANKPNNKAAMGLSGVLGAEVWFIPEFSAFAETGLLINNTYKADKETEFGTISSAIGVNFNFGY